MKEYFKISGKRVEIPAAGSWKFTPRPGGWVIAEAESGERRRFMMSEVRGKLSFALGGALFHGDIVRDARSSGGALAGSDADLVAQFPGKVRKILVTEGASVKEGEPLILVEAMKMEFSIKAPFSGKVTRILVKEAQQLAPGDRFLDMSVLEGEGNGG
ncbi:acetyl-CoA carboxylase biotin carboxyl carrier protein subunit [Bdellovibrionota bacterium FG-1]